MAKRKRKGLSKTLRFEIFKRDKFTCQYCGSRAPDAVLHCDHIHPVADGGADTILNLITACDSCNAGKGARKLSDDTALVKKRAELDRLAERREQIEMMMEWQRGLESIADYELQKFVEWWNERVDPFSLTDTGIETAKKMLRSFPLQDLLSAMSTAIANYVKRGEDGEPTHDSVNTAWGKIPGIARISKLPPDRQRLFYIRGILRNRFHYVNQQQAMTLMEDALAAGFSVQELEHLSKISRSWSDWTSAIEKLIEIDREPRDASA